MSLYEFAAAVQSGIVIRLEYADGSIAEMPLEKYARAAHDPEWDRATWSTREGRIAEVHRLRKARN